MPVLGGNIITAGGGVTDHGALTGQTDDDHTQYQKESEKGSASGYPGMDASGLVDATKGVQFPATQVASADGNALDDYEEGTWTPALTFATPGDQSIAYSAQVGSYTKVGRQVSIQGRVDTSTFTHGSASGSLRLTGLPFTSANVTNQHYSGGLQFSLWTKANYTQVCTVLSPNSTFITFNIMGSGQALDTLDTGDLPSATNIGITFTLTYWV